MSKGNVYIIIPHVAEWNWVDSLVVNIADTREAFKRAGYDVIDKKGCTVKEFESIVRDPETHGFVVASHGAHGGVRMDWSLEDRDKLKTEAQRENFSAGELLSPYKIDRQAVSPNLKFAGLVGCKIDEATARNFASQLGLSRDKVFYPLDRDESGDILTYHQLEDVMEQARMAAGVAPLYPPKDAGVPAGVGPHEPHDATYGPGGSSPSDGESSTLPQVPAGEDAGFFTENTGNEQSVLPEAPAGDDAGFFTEHTGAEQCVMPQTPAGEDGRLSTEHTDNEQSVPPEAPPPGDDAGFFTEHTGAEQSIQPDAGQHDAGLFTETAGGEQCVLPQVPAGDDAGLFTEHTGNEQSVLSEAPAGDDAEFFTKHAGDEQSVRPDTGDDAGFFTENTGNEQSMPPGHGDDGTGCLDSSDPGQIGDDGASDVPFDPGPGG